MPSLQSRYSIPIIIHAKVVTNVTGLIRSLIENLVQKRLLVFCEEVNIRHYLR